MRVALLGFLGGVGLLIACVGFGPDRPRASAQPPAGIALPRPGATDGTSIIAFDSLVGDTHQQITLIDPRQRVMCVYHIDRVSGEIALKSVRNIQWDLSMDEFNGQSPSPQEIRTLLQQR